MMIRQRVERLLGTYRASGQKPQYVQLCTFLDTGSADVYNISSPIRVSGGEVILGRVEHRTTEHSEVWGFEARGATWHPLKTMRPLTLQDPFWSWIGNTLVVGGVQIVEDEAGKIVGWKTAFYRGRGLHDLELFLVGPQGMKDIRLCGTADGQVCALTRPQGKKGGRGKIGYAVFPRLEDMTLEALADAPLLDQFDDDQWGGGNQALLLEDGRIGVLGHIARFSEGDVRHYYPMAFILDPRTGAHTPMRILVERQDLRPGPSKRPDLADVVFPGGIERLPQGMARLYLGVSDAHAQTAVIRDPFVGV